MKYYIYISDTKVDMLYPQVPQPLLKKITSSLNIDVKLLGAEVNIGAKGNPSDETRYAKVKIVSEYIEKHLDVGSVDAPSTYFKGTLPMRWTQRTAFGDDLRVVYFGGTTSRTVVGLGGSVKYVLGNASSEPYSYNRYISFSSLPAIYKLLRFEYVLYLAAHKLLFPNIEMPKGLMLTMAAYFTTHKIHEPEQQFEFLAKTLVHGPVDKHLTNKHLIRRTYEPDLDIPQTYVVLGTPIYVAIDD